MNNAPYKPSHYASVSPYLVTRGASRTIDFLVHVFNAEELQRIPSPSGQVMHAEVRLDDSILMLADGTDHWPAVESHVHVYVSDVDAVYERAVKFGAVPVQAPVQKSDADKRGGVKDSGGTTWWIATRVE